MGTRLSDYITSGKCLIFKSMRVYSENIQKLRAVAFNNRVQI